MRSIFRWLAVFFASIFVAKLAESFLTSALGRRLMERAGSAALVSDEGREIVRKYTKEAVTQVLDTLLTRRAHESEPSHRRRDWLNAIEDLSYIVTTAGALMRVATDFWRERRELRSK